MIALLLVQQMTHPLLALRLYQPFLNSRRDQSPERLPLTILRAQHGVLFRAQGRMFHNLHRKYLFLTVPLPKPYDIPVLNEYTLMD